MHETENSTRRKRTTKREPISERERFERTAVHVEPDWWSRLLALGSMLVAAAALWHARYPQGFPSVDGVATQSNVVAALNPGSNGQSVVPIGDSNLSADEDTKPASDPAPPTVSDDANPGVGGLKHALANEDQPKREVRMRINLDEQDLLDEPDPVTNEDDASYGDHEPADDGETANDSGGDEKEIDNDAIVKEAERKLEAFSTETDLVPVPSAEEAAAANAAEESQRVEAKKVAAGEPLKLELEGPKEPDNGLVVVGDVAGRPLTSEYAVTMTIRNTSDQTAVISNVAFLPREIIGNVSTDYASRPFGVSSAEEFVLAFGPDDNLAGNPKDQGKFSKLVKNSFEVPGHSTFDLRVAIENKEHLGYGLIGKLTLDYNTTESLNVENTAVGFVSNVKDDK